MHVHWSGVLIASGHTSHITDLASVYPLSNPTNCATYELRTSEIFAAGEVKLLDWRPYQRTNVT